MQRRCMLVNLLNNIKCVFYSKIFLNTYDMSDASEFKNIILSDRKMLISKIVEELRNVINLNELKKFANSLETKSNKILNSTTPPMPEKRRKKESRFRKISPYLAFCANYRDSQRNKDGKLTQNVLDVTREAGKRWQSMNTSAREPWIKKAFELTTVARAEWDAKEAQKMNSDAAKVSPPKTDDLLKMKRKELLTLLKDSSKSNCTLKELRNAVIEQFTTNIEKTTNTVPSTDEINRMKKNELISMADKIGLNIKDNKTCKSIQAAIIAHYHA